MTNTIPTVPNFLYEGFPSAPYSIAYGSYVFPPEMNEPSLRGFQPQIENSKSRLLDLLFVLPNATEATKWHEANRLKNPSHYSRRMLQESSSYITQLQRSTCPVLFFPMNCIDGPHSRRLWCKYGVVCEDQLIRDLVNWESFHFAGRLQKTALFFYPDHSIHQTPVPNLKDAINRNRIMAVYAALLCLPEIFTFKRLLKTIISLSYMGDIHFPLAEDPKKITNVLKSQTLPLANIYLNIVGATSDWKLPEFNVTHDRPSLFSSGHNEEGRRPVRPHMIFDPSVDELLSPKCIPSEIQNGRDFVSSEVFSILNKATDTLTNQAANRLSGTYEKVVISQPAQKLEKALLSDSFILQQNKSLEACEYIFSNLPASLRMHASNASSSLRFNRLVSPMSLIRTDRINSVLGRPLPFDNIAMEHGFSRMNRHSSIAVAKKSLIAAGVVSCMQHTVQKVLKRIVAF